MLGSFSQLLADTEKPNKEAFNNIVNELKANNKNFSVYETSLQCGFSQLSKKKLIINALPTNLTQQQRSRQQRSLG